ncbi:Werner Syndrome-like exonuclease isoform X2 [Macadamia integrifolia]|uniref:Werner Syndrome-like exonuclease isoform X2 n=1 Tax=Macadamia integrifolia TaxID=60698 RepID=UPI001C4E7418|nr:Werner Syndrome-like exonuclease isoform X2 [Macadamia integrifolia]
MASVYNTSQRELEVIFFEDNILATVTHSPSIVDQWLSLIQRIHSRRLHRLIVGFDVEWRPNRHRGATNPVAVLQLCVGRRCLIFQIRYSRTIPQSLTSFLNNHDYTFVGVGIRGDVNKLYQDYGLWVTRTMDLRTLAAQSLDMNELKRAGLKTLALVVLDKEVEKPHYITMSNWENFHLSDDQLQLKAPMAKLAAVTTAAWTGNDYLARHPRKPPTKTTSRSEVI